MSEYLETLFKIQGALNAIEAALERLEKKIDKLLAVEPKCKHEGKQVAINFRIYCDECGKEIQ